MSTTEDDLRDYYARLPDTSGAEQRLLHSPALTEPVRSNHRRVPRLTTATLVVLLVIALAAGLNHIHIHGRDQRGRPPATALPSMTLVPLDPTFTTTRANGITVHHPRSWRYLAATKDPSVAGGEPVDIGYFTNATTRPQCTQTSPDTVACRPPVAHLDRRQVDVILYAQDGVRGVRHRINATIDHHPAAVVTRPASESCPAGATSTTTAAVDSGPQYGVTVLLVCFAHPTTKQRHDALEMIDTLRVRG